MNIKRELVGDLNTHESKYRFNIKSNNIVMQTPKKTIYSNYRIQKKYFDHNEKYIIRRVNGIDLCILKINGMTFNLKTFQCIGISFFNQDNNLLIKPLYKDVKNYRNILCKKLKGYLNNSTIKEINKKINLWNKTDLRNDEEIKCENYNINYLI